jgi:hypothetical protein
MMPGKGWALAAAAAAVMFATTARGAGPAFAPPLSADERSLLLDGRSIVREQTIETERHRYVGGVTYTVIRATVDEVESIFRDVESYRHMLPRTKRARVVGQRGGDRFVELTQGNALLEASYTLRIRLDPGARVVRFWLDPSRPHGIEDAWGFFRYEALPHDPARPHDDGRVLVTYGVLVDLGPGLVRELFEERLRAMMLSVPQKVRQYLAERGSSERSGPSVARFVSP